MLRYKMIKMRGYLALAVLGAICASCSQRDETWVAERKTNVHASDSDTEEHILFTLAAGDRCTPVAESMQKVYLHTKIKCASGTGWVIDKQNFTITPSTQAK
jgi:hypothetical protein